MNKLIFNPKIITVFLFFFTFQNLVLALPTNEKDTVLKAARNELMQTLNQIPAGFESQYGFKNREEFNSASLNSILKVYFINSKSSDKELQILTSNEYRIPVIINNEYRALLTVSKIDGDWHIVDFGAVALAKEIENYYNIVPSVIENEVIFLRIYGINCDFITSKKADENFDTCKFYPLQSAKYIIQKAGLEYEGTLNKSTLFHLISTFIY